MASTAQFCFWIISPFGKRVRKYRVPIASLILFSAFIIGLLTTLSGVLVDYIYSQVGQRHSLQELRNVTKERNRLQESNKHLQAQLNSLEKHHSWQGGNRFTLEQRLNEIYAVIENATSLSLFSETKSEIRKNKTSKGIGGLEHQCSREGLQVLGITTTNCRYFKAYGSKQQLRSTVVATHSGASILTKEEVNGIQKDSLLVRFEKITSLLKVIPIGTPILGEITSGYGYRRSPFTRDIRFHEGIDISVPAGQYIFSTADGVVSYVGSDGAYGLTVEIRHNKHISTQYAHLSRTLVQEGETVCRGKVIGQAGSSGRSTGPHLHYEVRIHDIARDPKPFIMLVDRLMDLL